MYISESFQICINEKIIQSRIAKYGIKNLKIFTSLSEKKENLRSLVIIMNLKTIKEKILIQGWERLRTKKQYINSTPKSTDSTVPTVQTVHLKL